MECSLAIDHGKILKIGNKVNMPKAVSKMDLKNLLVLPGLVDAHVHVRGEGKTYKESFYSGTAAAVAGGFTTVLDMPNNDPVTMSEKSLRNRMETATRDVLANVAFYSEFPNKINEVAPIVREGAIAFKLFLSEQVGGLDVDDDDVLQENLGANKYYPPS